MERITHPGERVAGGELGALITGLSGRGRRESVEQDAVSLHSGSFVLCWRCRRTARAEACPLSCKRRAVVSLQPCAFTLYQRQCPLLSTSDVCRRLCSVPPQPFFPRPGIAGAKGIRNVPCHSGRRLPGPSSNCLLNSWTTRARLPFLMRGVDTCPAMASIISCSKRS